MLMRYFVLLIVFHNSLVHAHVEELRVAGESLVETHVLCFSQMPAGAALLPGGSLAASALLPITRLL